MRSLTIAKIKLFNRLWFRVFNRIQDYKITDGILLCLEFSEDQVPIIEIWNYEWQPKFVISSCLDVCWNSKNTVTEEDKIYFELDLGFLEVEIISYFARKD